MRERRLEQLKQDMQQGMFVNSEQNSTPHAQIARQHGSHHCTPAWCHQVHKMDTALHHQASARHITKTTTTTYSHDTACEATCATCLQQQPSKGTAVAVMQALQSALFLITTQAHYTRTVHMHTTLWTAQDTEHHRLCTDRGSSA